MAFEIYKRSQGKHTRLCTAFAVGLISAIGCYVLYTKLAAAEFSSDQKTALWIATMVPAGLFAILASLIFWLVNKPSIADFMIVAEGEMKKVSWSSRREIVVSTFIVIVTVIFMAVLLGVTDFSFQMFFDWLLR